MILGVTGTKGKTTICSLLHHALLWCKKDVVSFTTLGTKKSNTDFPIEDPSLTDLSTVLNSTAENKFLEMTSQTRLSIRASSVKERCQMPNQKKVLGKRSSLKIQKCQRKRLNNFFTASIRKVKKNSPSHTKICTLKKSTMFTKRLHTAYSRLSSTQCFLDTA